MPRLQCVTNFAEKINNVYPLTFSNNNSMESHKIFFKIHEQLTTKVQIKPSVKYINVI